MWRLLCTCAIGLQGCVLITASEQSRRLDAAEGGAADTDLDEGGQDTGEPGGDGGGGPGGDGGGDGGGDAGDDAGDDTAGGHDSAPPEDTDAVDPDAPVIRAFSVVEDGDLLRITFEYLDDQDDLEGGSAQITIDGLAVTYAYPDYFEVDDDRASLYLDADIYERDVTYEASLVLTDAAGHRSAAAATSFRRPPWTASVSEVGDEDFSGTSVGRVELPAEISGEVYGTGDSDWVIFQVPEDGDYRLHLTWDNATDDNDLALYNSEQALMASATSTTPDEIIDAALLDATSYYVQVLCYSGSAGGWTLRIERL
jgi:hypothetical protein